MSWNSYLHLYSTKRGGEFVGGYQTKYDCTLILRHRDMPIVIRAVEESQRLLTERIFLHLPVHLESPYTLRIRDKGTMSKGIALARSILPNSNDFGQPTLTKERNITSDNAPFTKMVLQDLALRNQLEKSPHLGVTVLPELYADNVHQISIAHASPPGLDSFYHSRESMEEQYKDCAFEAEIDSMVALAKATYDALTAYRMP